MAMTPEGELPKAVVATRAKVPALVPTLRVRFATVPPVLTETDVTLIADVWKENVAPARLAPVTVTFTTVWNKADLLLRDVMMGNGPIRMLPIEVVPPLTAVTGMDDPASNVPSITVSATHTTGLKVGMLATANVPSAPVIPDSPRQVTVAPATGRPA